jgi:hypothetical protein
MIKVNILKNGSEAIFHVLFNADLLLVNGFNLHKFVLIIEVQEKRIVYKVEVRLIGKIDPKSFHWLEKAN